MHISISMNLKALRFVFSLFLSTLFSFSVFAEGSGSYSQQVSSSATNKSNTASSSSSSKKTESSDDSSSSSSSDSFSDFLGGAFGCDANDKKEQEDEANAGGTPKYYENVGNAVQYLVQLDADCKTHARFVSQCGVANVQSAKENADKYRNNWKRCHDTQNAAAKVCLECNNSSLAGSLGMVNTVLSGAGAMGVNDQCSKMGKAFNIASMALTAYTTSCGVVKSGCGVICSQSTSGVQNLKALLPKIKFTCVPSAEPAFTGTGVAFCEKQVAFFQTKMAELKEAVVGELKTGTLGSVAGKGERCVREYGKLAASALAGAAQMYQHFKEAKQCEKATDASEQTAQAAATIDCKESKNANLPQCICELNPRNAGCSNGLTKAGSDLVDFDGRMPSNVPSMSGASNADLSAASGSGKDSIGSAGSSGSSGGPVAGGSGGGGSFGGGGGGSAGVDGATGEEALNAAGEYGDMGYGGGGGGWGAGGGSAEEDSALNDYLPGGEQDPNAMAGQEFPQDVTTEGGKSNWEKVRERYSDNQRSLLSN